MTRQRFRWPRFKTSSLFMLILGFGLGMMCRNNITLDWFRSDAPPTTQLVHVTGAVKAPGAYEIQQPTNVFDALAMAGGFASSADGSRVAIKRNSNGGRPVVTVVDVPAALNGKYVRNYFLRAGDVLTVPKRGTPQAI